MNHLLFLPMIQNDSFYNNTPKSYITYTNVYKAIQFMLKTRTTDSLCDNDSMKGLNTNNMIKPTQILCKFVEVQIL